MATASAWGSIELQTAARRVGGPWVLRVPLRVDESRVELQRRVRLVEWRLVVGGRRNVGQPVAGRDRVEATVHLLPELVRHPCVEPRDVGVVERIRSSRAARGDHQPGIDRPLAASSHRAIASSAGSTGSARVPGLLAESAAASPAPAMRTAVVRSTFFR